LLAKVIIIKVAKKNIGKAALIDKKKFFTLMSFFNDKIFSKFVSIQNQVDINKNIYI